MLDGGTCDTPDGAVDCSGTMDGIADDASCCVNCNTGFAASVGEITCTTGALDDAAPTCTGTHLFMQ